MAKIPFSKTDSAITVILQGVPHSIPRGDLRYPRLLEALRGDADEAAMLEIINDLPDAAPNGRTDSDFIEEIQVIPGVSYNGRELMLHGNPAPEYVSTKARGLFAEGFSLVPLANFLKRLPDSYRIRQDLLKFLDYGNNPLMDDGRFVAYKRVRSTFMDIHSNTFSNAPGQVLSMPRHEVDDDPNRTCSYGFHVCSYEYLSHFGSSQGSTDKVVAVAVAPEDVVSIPVDYNNTKMRCTGYVVLNELPMEWRSEDILGDRSYYSEDLDSDTIFCLYVRDENMAHDAGTNALLDDLGVNRGDDDGWALEDQFGSFADAMAEAEERYTGDDGLSYQVRNVVEDKVLAQFNAFRTGDDTLVKDSAPYKVTARQNGITLQWQECPGRDEAISVGEGMLGKRPGCTVEIEGPNGVTFTLNSK